MLRRIGTIAHYTLLEALRNRLIWLVGLAVLGGLGLGGFLGELAVTEGAQTQGALLGAFFRLAAVFLLAAFVTTSMVREFNEGVLELTLSLPLPRGAWLLGKFAGFAALAVLFGAVFGIGLLPFCPPGQALIWGLSLICELWIVAALCLLCVVTFSQVMAALSAALAFYLLARSIAAMQLMGQSSPSENTLSRQAVNFTVDALATLLPRLDEFTCSEWLAYGNASWTVLPPIAAQSLIYLLLLGAAALFDLYRKNL